MIKKKSLALSLAIILSISIAGCSTGTTRQDASPSSSNINTSSSSSNSGSKVVSNTDVSSASTGSEDMKRNEGTMENVDPRSAIAESVDLGLSVKWASFNVGASKPEEYGGLYGWADPKGEKTSTTNSDYPSDNPPSNISGTDYDIAHVQWGGSWRLPTREEQEELVSKCTWKKAKLNSVAGYRVTGKNGNSIFLPGVGGRIGNQTHYQVDGADYWSGTLSNDTNRAY